MLRKSDFLKTSSKRSVEKGITRCLKSDGDILAVMLTKEDKDFLTENFATKKELKEVRDGVDLLRQKLTTKTLENFNFEHRLDSIEASNFRTEEKIDKVLTILDGFAGKVADLDQENRMGAITLRRHDIQIHELATDAGV